MRPSVTAMQAADEFGIGVKEKPKRRRGRKWTREDGEWKEIIKPDPLPIPSEDPGRLMLQIEETGKASRLLEFLETAVLSPAFQIKHAARALDTLVVQRPSLREDSYRLNDQPGMLALVTKMEESLQSLEDQEESLGPRASALLMYDLAVYQDIGLLNRLVIPVATQAARAVPDMNNKQIALCVWAVAELKHVSRLLQDNLLPLMVQNNRILGVRSYLKAKAPFEHSLLKQALFKLRRDVPYLQDFLPAP